MKYLITEETVAHYPAIYDFVETAFKTAKVSDGTEQDFVDDLRAGGNYIPELALIAQVDGQIVGHIMFTKTYVTKPDGSRFDTLLVAPLAVALEYRGRGLGAELMNYGLELARDMGYESAFLCGDPDYYQRFGFKPTHLYGIRHEAVPEQYVMAFELSEGSLNGVHGMINM